MKITSLDSDSWSIEGRQYYLVQRERIGEEREYKCSCPDYFYRKSKLFKGSCKHIQEVLTAQIEKLEGEIYG